METFTDFTVVGDDGQLTLWKEDSDPDAPADAIEKGLNALAAHLGCGLGEFLGRTTLFVHGTTIASNTLIQRNGPRTGLLCTEGFRDVLYLRDGFKPDRFNVHMEHPGTLVDRHLRLPVRERIDRSGAVLTPIDEDGVRATAATFRRAGVESVAVGFLWSVINPAHEQRAAEILSTELKNVPVVCSSDIVPELREWQRVSAAVISAYLVPGIREYLRELENFLESSGYGRKPLIMQINGGCASVQEILQRPVNVLASGPAAAPAAAAFYGRAGGLKDIVTVDMGGTSFDVCLVRDGRAAMSRDIQVEHQPIGVPGVEVHSIGAGGGSIAWIDSGGALRAGPRSAGARPGPVAYDTGGNEPTVTDANIVLGYLDPDAFLGGRRKLRADLAEKAIEEKIARPLGISAVEAAAGIIRIVNANMVNAIRSVSVERGIDVRRFSLVAGGGAGGLHAAELARELQVERVLIPREAGTFCAFGMTVTDVRHDIAIAHHALSSHGDFSPVDKLFARLESEALDKLRSEGFAEDAIVLERAVDARYPGQVHELTVCVPTAESLGAREINLIEQAFHEEHQRQFTYARTELPVEFMHWRVTAVGKVPLPAPTSPGESRGRAEEALVSKRRGYLFETSDLGAMRVYNAERLVPGACLEGPAIVQAAMTTVVIGDGDSLTVEPDRSFLIKVRLRQGSRPR